MCFTISIKSVQYIYLRHCRFFAFLARCLSKVYSTRNSVFFALQYCYVKCCQICQNRKNGISQFLDKPNVSIAYKKNKLCNAVLYLNVMFQAYMIHNQEKHVTIINLLNTPLHIINGSLNDLKIIYKLILIFEFSCFFVSKGFHNHTSVIK